MKIPNWMLDQEIEYTPYSGSGAYGPVYDSTVTTQARVEYSKTQTMDDEGNEVVSDTKLYTRPDESLNPEAKVYHDSNTYTVIDLNKHRGLGADTHIEAVLL